MMLILMIKVCVCVCVCDDNSDDKGVSLCVCDYDAVDFFELFPNSNVHRFNSLTVVTLCRRTTLDKNSEQAADDGLLVDVCGS